MSDTLNVIELGQQLDQKRAAYKQKFESYPMRKLADGSEARDIPANDISGLRDMMSEINDLSVKHDNLRQLVVGYEENEGKFQRTFGKPENRPEVETRSTIEPEYKGFIGRFVTEAKGKGGLKKGFETELDFDPRLEFKTTMSTTAGYTPFSARSNVRIDTVQIRPTIFDYVSIIPIGQNSYKFMKESTFTNNAGVKNEGTAYDEAALALTETTVAMNRTGVYLPVTEDQLEDEPAARAYLEDRLAQMVWIKAEYQYLLGNGTEPQWEGVTGLSGCQSIAATSYGSAFDAVWAAIQLVNRTDATTYGGARANLVVLNPADWTDLVTMRTSDGIYILGNPGDAPMQRVWGIPVLQNYTLTANTALVMDTSYFPVGMRRGIRVAVTDSHGEYFIAGNLCVRVDLKGNVIPLRDAAACKITSFG